MKYFFGTLFCALIIAGCVYGIPEMKEKPIAIQAVNTNTISIELIGDELVRLNEESPIKINELKKQLLSEAGDKKPTIRIIANDDVSVGDLIDVQEILRESNMLRINYKTKSTG